MPANLRIILRRKICAAVRVRMVRGSMRVFAYFWLFFFQTMLIAIDPFDDKGIRDSTGKFRFYQ